MIAKIRDATVAFAPDLMGAIGAASLTYGAWLAWPPAGYIVAGALFLGVSILSARKAK